MRNSYALESNWKGLHFNSFNSYYWKKNKRWITLWSNETQVASRLNFDIFAPLFDTFAMQITVQDFFAYTNIYVWHAK